MNENINNNNYNHLKNEDNKISSNASSFATDDEDGTASKCNENFHQHKANNLMTMKLSHANANNNNNNNNSRTSSLINTQLIQNEHDSIKNLDSINFIEEEDEEVQIVEKKEDAEEKNIISSRKEKLEESFNETSNSKIINIYQQNFNLSDIKNTELNNCNNKSNYFHTNEIKSNQLVSNDIEQATTNIKKLINSFESSSLSKHHISDDKQIKVEEKLSKNVINTGDNNSTLVSDNNSITSTSCLNDRFNNNIDNPSSTLTNKSNTTANKDKNSNDFLLLAAVAASSVVTQSLDEEDTDDIENLSLYLNNINETINDVGILEDCDDFDYDEEFEDNKPNSSIDKINKEGNILNNEEESEKRISKEIKESNDNSNKMNIDLVQMSKVITTRKPISNSGSNNNVRDQIKCRSMCDETSYFKNEATSHHLLDYQGQFEAQNNSYNCAGRHQQMQSQPVHIQIEKKPNETSTPNFNDISQILCDCNRRYSAADVIKFKYGNVNNNNKVNTCSNTPSDISNYSNSITVPPSQNSANFTNDNVSTTSVTSKKLSNLKKSNQSNKLNKPKQPEKVKFSDVELRHLINVDKTIHQDIYSPDECLANQSFISNVGSSQPQKQAQLPILKPIIIQNQATNMKSSSSSLNQQSKGCTSSNFVLKPGQSNQQMTLSSPSDTQLSLSQASITGALNNVIGKKVKKKSLSSSSASKHRRRAFLKHSNTINEIDLNRLHRSNSGNYDPSAYYVNVDECLFKSSQPNLDNLKKFNPKLINLKHPNSDYDIMYLNREGRRKSSGSRDYAYFYYSSTTSSSSCSRSSSITSSSNCDELYHRYNYLRAVLGPAEFNRWMQSQNYGYHYHNSHSSRHKKNYAYPPKHRHHHHLHHSSSLKNEANNIRAAFMSSIAPGSNQNYQKFTPFKTGESRDGVTASPSNSFAYGSLAMQNNQKLKNRSNENFEIYQDSKLVQFSQQQQQHTGLPILNHEQSNASIQSNLMLQNQQHIKNEQSTKFANIPVQTQPICSTNYVPNAKPSNYQKYTNGNYQQFAPPPLTTQSQYSNYSSQAACSLISPNNYAANNVDGSIGSRHGVNINQNSNTGVNNNYYSNYSNINFSKPKENPPLLNQMEVGKIEPNTNLPQSSNNNSVNYPIRPASNAQITRLLTQKYQNYPHQQINKYGLNNSFKDNMLNEDSDNLLSAMSSGAKNYADLIAENAAFIDSPIRLLTNHHKNQRMLKQQKKLLIKNQQLTNALKNNKNKDYGNLPMNENTARNYQNPNCLQPLQQMNSISYPSQLQQQQQQQHNGLAELASPGLNMSTSLTNDSSLATNKNLTVNDNPVSVNRVSFKTDDTFTSKSNMDELCTEGSSNGDSSNKKDPTNEKNSETNRLDDNKNKLPLHKNKYLQFKIKKLLALTLTSIITIASVYLLETFSTFIQRDNTNLMILKLSTFITSFLFVIKMSLHDSDKIQADDDCKDIKKLNDDENEEDKENNESYYFINKSSNSAFLKTDSNDDDEAVEMICGPSSISSTNRKLKPKISCYYNVFLNYKTETLAQQHNLNENEQNENNFVVSILEGEGSTDKCLPKSLGKKAKPDAEIINMFKHIYQSKIKSNFYLIIVSILLIHFWIISTYLFGFIFSASSANSLIVSYKTKNFSLFFISNLIEIFSAIIGGIGIALFFKNIILALYEITSSNRNQLFKKIARINNPNFEKDGIRLNRKHLIESIFKKEQIITVKKYHKLVLKYSIVLQLNWILLAGFLLYVINITGTSRMDKILTQVCLESIVNLTRSQICPSSIRNSFFNWRNEIFHRKIKLQLDDHGPESKSSKSVGDSGKHDVLLSSNKMLRQAYFVPDTSTATNENQSHFNSYHLNNKMTPIEDIYLLLISVSLVNFFVSLIIPLLLIKSNKQSKKIFKSSSSFSSNSDLSYKDEENTDKFIIANSGGNLDESEKSDGDHGGFLTKKMNNLKSKKQNRKKTSLVQLHLMMPLVFFQGFIKTILFNELNKWYAGCLNGAKHLNLLLFYYGIGSFLSLLIIAALIIFCKLKRTILFLLAFIQQLTLIIILFYWDPTKSNDFKAFYIDYIFFVCYAICDNLWLAHNIRCLMTKSNELQKSPCVILIYAYSILNLGSFFGYTGSIYFCFTIKIYLSLIFLIAFSFIYLFSEMTFFLKSKFN